MQAGKLPNELLTRLLCKIEINDPRVVLGPKVGEDAALIDNGDKYLVLKSDPITFATDSIGWYMVQVNANDLAVMGATPKWLMTTLLLPDGSSETLVEDIFDQITTVCKAMKIDLVGGHTEITGGLSRPIAVGALIGEVCKGDVVLTSGAKVGDSIVLTKSIGIEGTTVLAREAEELLIAGGLDESFVDRAKGFLWDPGISVVIDASIARSFDIHSMHDPTEGGLITGLLEMAQAANVGMIIDIDSVPVLPETDAFCRILGLDPLGLISSGSLIVSVDVKDVGVLIGSLKDAGLPAVEIGRLTEPKEGLRIIRSGLESDMPEFPRDELARFFERQKL